MSLEQVTERILAAEVRSGREEGSVELVVVTKNRSLEQIEALYRQGHRDFGENRAQELGKKAIALPNEISRDIRWHFIGSLQTNKTPQVRIHTHLLHSLDRLRLAEALLKGPGFPPPVLVQVNISAEESKHGFDFAELEEAVGTLTQWGITVRGLMGMAALTDHPEETRPVFSRLRQTRDRLQTNFPELTHLSMGMSNDFEIAIEEGATLVRIGQAVFD